MRHASLCPCHCQALWRALGIIYLTSEPSRTQVEFLMLSDKIWCGSSEGGNGREVLPSSLRWKISGFGWS
jgi:hypothetical protein